ncbi:alkylation response protein AidB-like acyl-CoA dehydrogenase [Paraburkholderia sp. HC6.4b]|uniref:acyl-CoA dehydrogenase family protein n=1 Tax=unclassified Paraburkholderia TaxID=2615204 RepID=UPI001620F152|nr:MULTISPECIES: acyl-CoA dehydrogenase family protein [unclassified Paraburkholderia]MBB5406309.1 alkylation response protein AidB-like acyl-CoA dehydrogenase [Paraburkholderia sp. HC6.4b]MBB5448707.1 alkylation response protein AidB-like acyl-CoA dehydrogenase [Paraburkholderia sp. Kb1A]
MFVEAIEAILNDHCAPSVVRTIDDGASPAPLWRTIVDSGFLELLAPEAHGGAGLTLDVAFPVIECIGRYAVPVPVAQTIVSRALLGAYGVAVSDLLVDEAMIAFASSYRFDGRGTMHCPLTPDGQIAEVVLADQDDDLVVLSCARATRIPTGVHGSQCSTLRWDEPVEPIVRVARGARALHACAASVHAALLAGAMNRVFAMTLQYANDRAQFGKPIGKFQAVQQQLAMMAAQVAAATIAAERGFSADETGLPSLLRAATAKARTSEAVTTVAATAHALHGAIGVTREYDLQLFTRRMHAWRIAHGSEQYWHAVVGEALLASRLAVGDFGRVTL